MKKTYIKPIAEFEETEDDLMLISASQHTTTTDYNNSPLENDYEDFPGYLGEVDPDEPGEPPFFF